MAANRDNSFLEIYQEYFGDLVTITESSPGPIAAKLFSKKLILNAVLREIASSHDSGADKALKLLLSVESQLKICPEKLEDFIKVIEQEPAYDGITSQIKSKLANAEKITKTATLSSAFSRYRNYLKSYYDTNPVARDDKLFIAPCSEFISLALVMKDKSVSKYDTFSQSTLYGGTDQISAHKVPLELDDILTSEDKLVFVEGAPGIGKSTLSWELCRKWDTLKSLQHYSIVLLLKLRERRVQNASSLNELFYHRDRALCESVVSEVLRCEGEDVLLILDGFDEMPASVARNKESLIMEIISGTCIPRATRLVTSRPSALHHTILFPQEFRHVEIVGFTNEKIRKFAEIAFKSESNVLSEFKKFIFSNPMIKSLMYIPVNCAILAQSYKDIMRSSKQVPKTTTQLYTMLTRVLIRRHLIATGRWEEDSEVPSDLKDLPEDVKGDLERVSTLAFIGLFKEDVQLVFTDSDVGDGFHPLGLLSEEKELYVCDGARTSYSFLHLSIQEFLAAWYVSCHRDLEEDVIDITMQSLRRIVEPFGYFLAGLVGLSVSILYYMRAGLINPFSEDSNLRFACYCLYEEQQPSRAFEILQLISKETYPLSLTTPMDVYVFGYCLAYGSIKWSDVTISTSIDMLVTSLADHAQQEISSAIESLDLTGLEISSYKLKDLPFCLLNSIRYLEINSTPSSLALLEDMPALPLMEVLDLGMSYSEPFENEYMLYETISRVFPNIKVMASTLKQFIMKSELTKVFTRSLAIEKLILSIPELVVPSDEKLIPDFFDSVVDGALSCPSLESLVTNFPFILCTGHTPKNHLQAITVDINSMVISELPRLFQCIFGIASLCKAAPLQTLSIKQSFFHQSILPYDCIDGYYDCISLLNVCLHHHWPSMKELELPFSIPCAQFHLSSLSRALRRDPDTSQLKLRRSKSLSDLAYLKALNKHFETDVITFGLVELRYHINDSALTFRDDLKRSQSCPSLLEIHSLHPLLKLHRNNCQRHTSAALDRVLTNLTTQNDTENCCIT